MEARCCFVLSLGLGSQSSLLGLCPALSALPSHSSWYAEQGVLPETQNIDGKEQVLGFDPSVPLIAEIPRKLSVSLPATTKILGNLSSHCAFVYSVLELLIVLTVEHLQVLQVGYG